MRTAPRVELSEEDRAWLEKVSRSRVEAVRLSERALVVLMAADGKTNREIGMSLGITEEKAARWRGRFLEQGRIGLEQDAPSRGRKPTYPPEIVSTPRTNIPRSKRGWKSIPVFICTLPQQAPRGSTWWSASFVT